MESTRPKMQVRNTQEPKSRERRGERSPARGHPSTPRDVRGPHRRSPLAATPSAAAGRRRGSGGRDGVGGVDEHGADAARLLRQRPLHRLRLLPPRLLPPAPPPPPARRTRLGLLLLLLLRRRRPVSVPPSSPATIAIPRVPCNAFALQHCVAWNLSFESTVLLLLLRWWCLA